MATIVADAIKWVLSHKLLRQQIFSEKNECTVNLKYIKYLKCG